MGPCFESTEYAGGGRTLIVNLPASMGPCFESTEYDPSKE